MHIEIEQSLQKIASNVYSDIKDEEKDWALNKAQLRFVKNKVNPLKKDIKFQGNEKSLDDIQSLIVHDTVLDFYIKPSIQVGNNTINFYEGYSYFPANYLYLSADRSVVMSSCPINVPSFDTFKTTKVLNIYRIPFDTSSEDISSFSFLFNTLNIFVGNSTTFSDDSVRDKDLNKFALGYGTKWNNAFGSSGITDLAFYAINILQDFINIKCPIQVGSIDGTNNLLGLYWEKYLDTYIPGNFILVTSDPIADLTLTSIKGVQAIDISKISGGAGDNRVSYYNPPPNSNLTEQSNRLVKSSEEFDVNSNNTFYKTISKSPISVIDDFKLRVLFSNSFIITNQIIKYIRKPQFVSLYLNQHSELSPSVHQEICDMAVEEIQLITDNPNVRNKIDYDLSRGNIT